jgi:hypothetical protein
MLQNDKARPSVALCYFFKLNFRSRMLESQKLFQIQGTGGDRVSRSRPTVNEITGTRNAVDEIIYDFLTRED